MLTRSIAVLALYGAVTAGLGFGHLTGDLVLAPLQSNVEAPSPSTFTVSRQGQRTSLESDNRTSQSTTLKLPQLPSPNTDNATPERAGIGAPSDQGWHNTSAALHSQSRKLLQATSLFDQCVCSTCGGYPNSGDPNGGLWDMSDPCSQVYLCNCDNFKVHCEGTKCKCCNYCFSIDPDGPGSFCYPKCVSLKNAVTAVQPAPVETYVPSSAECAAIHDPQSSPPTSPSSGDQTLSPQQVASPSPSESTTPSTTASPQQVMSPPPPQSNSPSNTATNTGAKGKNNSTNGNQAWSHGTSPSNTYAPSPEGDTRESKPWNIVPAPAPGYQAKAPTLADPSSGEVSFTLVLTGHDALDSNGNLLKAVWQTLTGSVAGDNLNYLTSENTALTTVKQLGPLTSSKLGRRRVLHMTTALPDASVVDIESSGAVARNLAEAKCLSKTAGQSRGCSKVPDTGYLPRRSLVTGASSPGTSDTPMSANNNGPVPSLALSYKVTPVPEQGLTATKQGLTSWINSGQFVQSLRNQSFQIDYVQLRNFTSVSGAFPAPAPALTPAPAPAPEIAPVPAPVLAPSPASTDRAGALKIALAPAVLGSAASSAPSVALPTQLALAPAQPPNALASSVATASGPPTSTIGAAAGVAAAVGLGVCAVVIWLLVRRRRGARVDSGGTPGKSSARSSLSSGRPGLLTKSSGSSGSDDYQSTLDGACVAFERRPSGELWLLGQGKFGKVYKGRFLKQLVAIKVLTDNSPEQQEAFRQETLLMRNLRHPHIVQYLGHTQLDGNMLLILEFMQGGSLAAAIAADNKNSERRLAWHRQGRGIALGIASGLHYLHSKRVIWFDCKSQNILLDASGMIAKISDVGISKILLNTCTQAFMRGTVGYLAPELVPQLCGTLKDTKGEPSGVSHAVDIYSFGIVLWEIITGENPHSCNGYLRTPRVPEECSADVVTLYQQCLTHNITERPTIETISQKLHAEMAAHYATNPKA